MNYTAEQLSYVAERIDSTTDLDQRCVWCLEDTSFGSGRFVNRIPVFTDASGTDWYGDLDPALQAKAGGVDGYGCAVCSGYECDICSNPIALDEDVADTKELGHYHPECLPLEDHYKDGDQCGCWLHQKEQN